MLLSPGEKLGPYEILAPIGAGGMGEVYKARDSRLDRIVAVKRLNRQHSSRFSQEARAIAALNHPNICQIYDVGPDYLIMEYVEGKSIAGPLPLDDALRLALQIAHALEEAHGRGILHRDLKPANVLVTSAGTAKLIDFGLAKLKFAEGEDVTQSVDGAILGTLAYMAPEQAEGQTIDERSDVFSFGALLYEMLSGKRAFRGTSAMMVLSSVLRDHPARLPVPSAVQHIVDTCLAKSPRERFAGMSAVRAALEELTGATRDKAAEAGHPDRQQPHQTNVGRERECEIMRRAYDRVKGGRGIILAITGEAGIGKTSLLEDFLSELTRHAERPVIGRGRCSQRLAGEEPYLPILEVLESLANPRTGPSLAGVIKLVAPTWYALVSHESSDASSVGEGFEGPPAASQERMKREFCALCQELARTQPLVLFIDDLHWADVSTIDILNYVAGRFDETRMLALGSFRPSDMALRGNPFLAIRNDLQSRGFFQEIALPFLALKDVQSYLAIEFPGHRFPADFATVIHSKTEGSPLFMADLVRYLRDTGGIVEEDGVWALARALPEAPRDLPASVRGMIQRKIEQVEEVDRKLLLAASVQGPEFDSAVVAEAIEMDPADVEERLDVLERIHVFVRRGVESEFADRSLTLNYQFVHVLYQNALYESLQPTRRASLSGRVARALVKHHGDEVAAVAAPVAVLFEAARDFAAAARYYHMAAARSAELFAFREALALAERGLNAVKALPDSAAGKQQELALQMTKGTALRSTSGWSTPQIEQVFSRARQLVQSLDDPPELIPVLWATTLFLLIRGSLVECRDRCDELMRQAERSGNRDYLMAAHHISGVVREFTGEMVESSRLLEMSRSLHDPARHSAYAQMFGQDPGATARAMSARPLFALGYPDKALERAEEILAIARAQRYPTHLAFALVVIQGIHLYRGEAAASLAVADEIAALCREYELPQEAEWSKAFTGFALHLAGRTAEGIDVMKESLARQKAISAGLVRSAFLALLADALCHAGRGEEGLAAIEEGFAHSHQTAEGGYVAELHRVRGQLMALAGDRTGAEASLRAALEYSLKQETRSFQLRAATELAKLLHTDGRSEEARSVLTPAYNWFTEGFDTADLRSARLLLSEIG